MLFLLTSLAFAETPKDWTLIGTTDGVEVARKQVEGKNVFAFRGEATTDVSVEILATVLSDESVAPKWVDMMISSDVLKTYSSGAMLLHQKYDIPWPMDDRDYVFKKEFKVDLSAQSVERFTMSILILRLLNQIVVLQNFCKKDQMIP